jgi:DNA polymerase-3 subunit delta
MFYIFHGEDEFSRAEQLAELKGRLAGGDPAMADLNTTVLDGNRLTLSELRHVCDAIPFMAERRLVIVNGLLGRTAPGRRKKGAQGQDTAVNSELLAELGAYLPNLPPTTRLMFVEGETLADSHPILRLAKAEEKRERAYVRVFDLPEDRQLPGWIQQRARAKGGYIDADAAYMMANLVGRDTRLLDQEIEKLLVYAGDRSVLSDDVQKLVSRAREASIFDLVDSVGQRQTKQALGLLHRLLEDGAAPLYLLTMLARQVRILIQVAELQDEGLAPQDMTTRLKLHPFVVKKGLAQARNFDMAQLVAAHRYILDTDWSIKTGRIEEVLALDLLVAELASL